MYHYQRTGHEEKKYGYYYGYGKYGKYYGYGKNTVTAMDTAQKM